MPQISGQMKHLKVSMYMLESGQYISLFYKNLYLQICIIIWVQYVYNVYMIYLKCHHGHVVTWKPYLLAFCQGNPPVAVQ